MALPPPCLDKVLKKAYVSQDNVPTNMAWSRFLFRNCNFKFLFCLQHEKDFLQFVDVLHYQQPKERFVQYCNF